MWPLKPKHLQYSSVFAWNEAEKIHGPITDEKLKSKYMDQLGELRQYLFKKHLETLSQIEQEQLNLGSHPSQSHEKAGDAVKYVELLKSDLLQNGFDIEVKHGCYHMNRVIISVFPDNNINRANLAKIVPQFFHGYEVMVIFKKQ